MPSNISRGCGRSDLLAKKVFFDTNPLIYFVSGYEPYYSKVFDFFTECIENDVEFYTSTITDAEFLSKPFRDGNFDVVERYRIWLRKLDFLKCFITEQVAEKAAFVRAKYQSIKLADALQIAASLECNCDVFFTNDKQLKQITEIKVVYLGEL